MSSRGPVALVAAGALIAAAFWALAWLEPRPCEPVFMIAIGVAVLGYVCAVACLTRNPLLSKRTFLVCIALALAWRVPLLSLPASPAHDAVRYIWDARVQRAGLNPYGTRPDDPVVQPLHSDVTREVDASWLPTIYPSVAQLYFRTVTAVDESITAFRVAALLCDGAIMLVLTQILRATGRPVAWMLAYAWHPLVPLEGASGAHVDLAGVLALVLSWLALIRGRTLYASVAFVAAVLVKPLPLVLAPLFWRRVRISDALFAAMLGSAATVWIARGHLPVGSMGTFVDTFRFNAPVFVMLEHVAPARVVAAGAVLAGLIAAACLRRTHDAAAPHVWAWPMMVALIGAPVIYPWYLIWLIPFAIDLRAIPVWVWSLSIVVIYRTWHLRALGEAFEVPPELLVMEFALPALAALLLARRLPNVVGATHPVHE